MVELVIYPDIESLLIGYLRPVIVPAKVSTTVPNPRPDRFVKVTAMGGSDRTMVTSRRLVVVQCWDKAAPAAAELAELCFAALKASALDPAAPRIRSAETVGAPQFFPDPDTNLPRYQFTLAFDLRGAVR